MAVRLTIRTIALSLAVLALAACAKGWLPTFEARLDPLKGQPIQALIDRIGPPDEETTVDERRVEYWYGLDKAHPWMMSECTIKATLDKAGRIADLFYSGNDSGCHRYAQMLEKD